MGVKIKILGQGVKKIDLGKKWGENADPDSKRRGAKRLRPA